MSARAFFVAAIVALATSTTALAQSPSGGATQEAIAQSRFAKGRELFIANRYAEALVEFRAASELFESPNTRLYIARCERELGHFATAYVELERAASEASDRAHSDPRYASTRDVAKQEAAALEGKLAHVTILAPPGGLPDGTVITVNGSPLAAAGVGVAAPIDPGTVDVVAKAPGHLPLHRTAQVAKGESVEIKIRLEPAPGASGGEGETTAMTTTVTSTTTTNATTASQSEQPAIDTTPHAGHGLRNAGFVVGGIGIVGMGVFATFAALAQTRFDQLKTQCNGGPCDPSYSSQIDEGQTYQNVANIALAVGGAGLVVGAIMIIAGMSANAPAPPSTARANGTGWASLHAAVVPTWSAQGPSGLMLGVGRDF